MYLYKELKYKRKKMKIDRQKMVKWLNKWREKLFPEYKMDGEELKIFKIVENSLRNDKTESKMDPTNGEYIIYNRTIDQNIDFEQGIITISNHDYYISRQCSSGFQGFLEDIAIKYIKEDIRRIKTEIFKNKLDLLKKIEKQIII